MAQYRSRGHTLTELLSAITIASILAALSVTSFSAVVRKSRLNTALEMLLHTIDRTRSLSSLRNKRAAFCIMDTSELCSSEWRGTYLTIFVDSNKNRQRDIDEEIFYRQPWESSNLNISWNRPNEMAIIFQPDGSAVLNGTLQLKDNSGSVFKKLVISKMGRTRIE